MGIPQLIATLEPYATHTVLNDTHVVIDGPSLAHHILHVCRVNGLGHPSYELLGSIVILWLDKLASQNVVVEKLYFDGFLPSSKLPVRMERTLKSTSQISFFYKTSGGGCPKAHIRQHDEPKQVDAFLTGRLEMKPFAAPSFLVPAILDALRNSSRYGKLVCIVAGEADSFCARHAARTGASVLTSDSDLLVHNIGTAGVILLRDIYKDNDAVVRCSVYTPQQIFTRLGLSTPSGVYRFAYERWRTTHATVSSLVRVCEDQVTDEDEYRQFCTQYLSEGDEEELVPSPEERFDIQHLDPRWCEVLLQLSQNERDASTRHSVKMFLPILIDNPDRGTAWEQSTPLRRIAYSIAWRKLPGHTSTVHEYRRVQTLDQKGRQISVLPTQDMFDGIDELGQVMWHLKTQTEAHKVPFWLMLYAVLDARECFAQGKDSHALSTLLRRSASSWPGNDTQRISWDFMHFVAQLQAVYYSLRMLWQVLRVSHAAAATDFGSSVAMLREMLDKMPGLEHSPDVESVLQFLYSVPQEKMRQVMAEFVDVPAATAKAEPVAQKRDAGAGKKSAPKAQKPSARKQNMFDMLAME